MKVFSYIVITVVAVAVISSFFIIGGPQTERERQLDRTRVNDLSVIKNEIVNFWSNKDKLPQDLAELENDVNDFTVPRDPETSASYEYRVLDKYQFELCATFT